MTFASFLLKFGLYGEALELSGNFFDATSKYSLTNMKKNVKIEALGRLWTCLGKLLASLCMPSCRLAVFVEAFCRHLGYFMQKSWILRYRCHCRAESLFEQVWATKLEPLGPKVLHKVRRNGEKLPRQAKSEQSFADQFCLAVGVMETAREPPGRSPDLSQAGGQSLSKRQVI